MSYVPSPITPDSFPRLSVSTGLTGQNLLKQRTANYNSLLNQEKADVTELEDDQDALRTINRKLDAFKRASEPLTDSDTFSLSTDKVADKAEQFVNQLNDAIVFLDDINDGTLSGDQLPREISRKLKSELSRKMDFTGSENIQSLSDVGIELNAQGQFEFDRSEFELAFDNNKTAVENLFTDSEQGVATKSIEKVNEFTQPFFGRVNQAIQDKSEQLRGEQQDVNRAEDRLKQAKQYSRGRLSFFEQQLIGLEQKGNLIDQLV